MLLGCWFRLKGASKPLCPNVTLRPDYWLPLPLLALQDYQRTPARCTEDACCALQARQDAETKGVLTISTAVCMHPKGTSPVVVGTTLVMGSGGYYSGHLECARRCHH